MRKNPRRILSPQRLPFRHPGIGRRTKLTSGEAGPKRIRERIVGPFPSAICRGDLSRLDVVLEAVRIEGIEPAAGRFRLRVH
jgi:hypothetical protein